MIIGTCGFSWSGSSAVADYLAEFEENQVYNEREFVLAFHPDGLQDLDYHLNTQCAKFLSSTVAIARYKRIAHYLLDEATQHKIDKLTQTYIDSLVQTRWHGFGQGQVVLHNPTIYKKLAENLSVRCIRHLPPSLCRKIKPFPFTTMELSIEPEQFDERTREYTDNILRAIGLNLQKNIVLDQPFPGNNPQSCLKYYRNARAIVVDRDPRDLYMLAVEYFPRRSYSVSHETVDDFIQYYYHMHKKMRYMDCDDVLVVRFEDLIFEYESTTKIIKDFLGIQNHTMPKQYFKPEKSIANTRLFMKSDKYKADIRRIETKLGEFIYDFEKYQNVHGSTEMFDENPPIDWRRKVSR